MGSSCSVVAVEHGSDEGAVQSTSIPTGESTLHSNNDYISTAPRGGAPTALTPPEDGGITSPDTAAGHPTSVSGTDASRRAIKLSIGNPGRHNPLIFTQVTQGGDGIALHSEEALDHDAPAEAAKSSPKVAPAKPVDEVTPNSRKVEESDTGPVVEQVFSIPNLAPPQCLNPPGGTDMNVELQPAQASSTMVSSHHRSSTSSGTGSSSHAATTSSSATTTRSLPTLLVGNSEATPTAAKSATAVGRQSSLRKMASPKVGQISFALDESLYQRIGISGGIASDRAISGSSSLLGGGSSLFASGGINESTVPSQRRSTTSSTNTGGSGEQPIDVSFGASQLRGASASVSIGDRALLLDAGTSMTHSVAHSSMRSTHSANIPLLDVLAMDLQSIRSGAGGFSGTARSLRAAKVLNNGNVAQVLSVTSSPESDGAALLELPPEHSNSRQALWIGNHQPNLEKQLARGGLFDEAPELYYPKPMLDGGAESMFDSRSDPRKLRLSDAAAFASSAPAQQATPPDDFIGNRVPSMAPLE